jgi:hypothetical protein
MCSDLRCGLQTIAACTFGLFKIKKGPWYQIEVDFIFIIQTLVCHAILGDGIEDPYQFGIPNGYIPQLVWQLLSSLVNTIVLDLWYLATSTVHPSIIQKYLKPQTCVHGRCVVNYGFAKYDFIQCNCVAQLKQPYYTTLCLQEKVGLPNVS